MHPQYKHNYFSSSILIGNFPPQKSFFFGKAARRVKHAMKESDFQMAWTAATWMDLSTPAPEGLNEGVDICPPPFIIMQSENFFSAHTPNLFRFNCALRGGQQGF